MVENILIRDSDLREVILLCTNGHFINNSTFIRTGMGDLAEVGEAVLNHFQT